MTLIEVAPEMPSFDLDPYEVENLRHPEEFHRRLRESAPMVWMPRYGILATGRFAQVRAGFKQWQDLTSAGGAGLEDRRGDPGWQPSLLLHTDPPSTRRAAS